MTNFEIDDILKSFEILVDTREQPNRKAQKRYSQFGCPVKKRKLEYGDYTFNFTTQNGPHFKEGEKVFPEVVIERKMDLVELSQCFCQSRKRFREEFERAKAHNSKIFLIVENSSFENLYAGKYGTKFNSKAFTASLWAWTARYNISTIFCKAEISGKIIKDILYRELKERLERGDYDG